MENKDNINIFELHLKILNDTNDAEVLYIEKENEIAYGIIIFKYEDKFCKMFFDKGMLKEIKECWKWKIEKSKEHMK